MVLVFLNSNVGNYIMKKILLGTTVLGAALLAGAAHADTPKVTLGGFAEFQAGFVSQDDDLNERGGAFRNESEVVVNVDGKTDAGLGYGAQINVVTSGTENDDAQADQSPRSFVYLDGAWGRVQGGSDLGVTSTMKIGAESIARATGGIDGDFNYFMSAPGVAVIATPDLFLDYGTYGTAAFGNETSENINKISYYTPRFMGVQAGVSYLFDSSATDTGISLSRSDNDPTEAEGIILGGLNYEGKFSDVEIGLAATGEYGDAESAAEEDLRTWNVGGKVGYMGFSVAASYGDYGDSMQALNSGLDDNNYWTVGAAYETGPFGVSVTYLESNYEVAAADDNEFSNLSFGADYKLAPGLTPYAEVSLAEVDAAGTASDNDATVFIAGTQLQF
jgi:hypothetical protein